LINQELLNEAIKIFELNVEVFPEYANGYDSLGDAYLKVNDPERAMVAWGKAIALGSEFTKEKLNELRNK
jgi:tetratricopeptide (TPR) repeat protein